MDALILEFLASSTRFPEWVPRWNIAPTSTIPIVATTSDGERIIGPAHWSLIPSWSTQLTLTYPTFNARSETAAEKPTFRDALKSTRCLIPVSGYYEWSSEAGAKTPYYLFPDKHRVAALAGLYSWWTNPADGIAMATTTLLTRSSVGCAAEVHDRMPVILDVADVDTWLDPGVSGASLLESMSAKAGDLIAGWSYHRVNAVRGEGAHLVEDITSS